MFKKALFAKFEWGGLPKPLTDIFVEKLLFSSKTQNFAVVLWDNVEFWAHFNVLDEYEKMYGLAQKIQVNSKFGGTYSTDDFVLFDNFKSDDMIPDAIYIKGHTAIIRAINEALQQHIAATELIATVYASSAAEAKSLKSLYRNFPGVKIVENANNLLQGEKRYDIVQFNITPRMAELEELKHNIENDLFLRLGIDTGLDKTHITNSNLKDSEQVIDLINSYELKRREDFCERLTEWRRRHGNNTPCTVKIHTIDKSNTVEKVNNTGGDNNADDNE